MSVDRNDKAVARRAGYRIEIWRAAFIGAAVSLLGWSSADGHGWHGGPLSTGSLDEWLADVKTVIPDIEHRITAQGGGTSQLTADTDLNRLKQAAADAKAGSTPGSEKPNIRGTIQTKPLTPEQQAFLGRKANDCLEVMAYMNPRNIIPEEFPKFKLAGADEYRHAAKRLMELMGPAGTTPMIGVIRNEMMGAGASQSGLVADPRFQQDLLDVLENNIKQGNLTAEQVQALMDGAKGRKPPAQARFAEKVQEVLWLANKSLEEMSQAIARTENPRVRKQLVAKLRQRLDEADVVELLNAQLTAEDGKLRQAMGEKLRSKTPRYSEVEDQLPEIVDIWKRTGSSDQQVAASARYQLTIAFLQAPIRDCMEWIGRGDQQLNTLIWQQLDDRISRAAPEGRSRYRNTGLYVAQNSKYRAGSRAAALDFLVRLKDPQAVGPLSEALPLLPRELWPKAGETLRRLTGEEYGPRPGDGVAEVFESAKKWRAWWKQHGGK